MASVLILNQSNVTQQNNVFQYNFPSGSVNFKDKQIAVQSIILPYSWYNITSTYNNQAFNITIPRTDGVATTTLNIIVPSGFYTVAQLNSYIQSQLIANNIGYLVNASGANVYYIEIVANLNLNSAQLNCYVVPNSLPVGYTNPASWALPTVGTRVPQLTTLSNNFGLLIGFASSTTFPASSTQSSTYSITSSFTPTISPVESVLVNCNLVNNILSVPSNIITAIPITSSFGTQIQYSPNELIWLPILDGTYPYFRISFLDQISNQLGMNDTNIVMSLLIK